MQKILTGFFLVVAIGLAAVPRVQNYMAVPPEAAPADTFGLDVVVPKTVASDRAYAMALSGLCDGIADMLELDGKRATPLLTKVFDIEDLRKASLEIPFDGKKVKDVFPEFGAAVKPVFSKELLDDTAALTPELRKKSVALFTALAYSCREKTKK